MHSLGSVMSVLLVALWLFLFVSQARAVLRRDIWSHGKDEDVYIDETKHSHVKPSKVKADAGQEKLA